MVNTSIDFFRKNKNEYLLLGDEDSIEKYMPVEYEEEEDQEEREEGEQEERRRRRRGGGG